GRENRPRLTIGLALFAALSGFVAVSKWPGRQAPLRMPTDRSVHFTAAPTPSPVKGLSAQRAETVQTPSPDHDRGRVPVYFPREKGEWQGMLVNMTLRAQCDTSSRCALAAACLDGLCGPCSHDRECADSEVCVLDH